MNKKRSLIVLATALLLSCSKKNRSENDTEQEPVRLNAIEQQLLGSWKIHSAYKYDLSTFDTTNELRECMTEDVFTFKNDKRYDVDLGKDDCSPYSVYGSSEKANIPWDVNTDSVMNFRHWFHFSGPKIVEITDRKFVLKRSYYDFGSYAAIYTFVKQ